MDLLERPEFIIIHHSGRQIDSPTSIKNLHVNKNGWEDIGYHFIIGNDNPFVQDGKVYFARPEKFVGAHALGFNKNSLGICLIGNFDTHKPTKAQIEILIHFLRKKMLQYEIPAKNVFGHRELQGVTKTCPGTNFNMDWLRQQISFEKP